MKKVFRCVCAWACSIAGVYAGTIAEDALLRGQGYSARGDYDEAIKEYTKAIDSDGRNAAAYYGRGLAYHKKGNLSKAIDDYDAAIGNDSRNAEVYFNRGIAYYYKDDLDRAIADWGKAIEVRPEAPEAYQKRAFAYYKREQYDWAWDDVRQLKKMGFTVDANFLENLKRYSGKES